ncbi:hypothetical protein C4D60_Mb04t08810 [Musa balbisiana]|uniref:Uncharacterized protein n=1 Tax=Musa balbisiana TaxID=52838 RepID=A0A4V4H9M0_MUSBA|nr:hypothetical protein C4D60_Mb04t08810 [Musa balbisiana]
MFSGVGKGLSKDEKAQKLALQHWLEAALDFASLEHSSVSFFKVEKPETAASRWARARTRAAKVGKGLSKDEKAQKLALQHWLEAVRNESTCSNNILLH